MKTTPIAIATLVVLIVGILIWQKDTREEVQYEQTIESQNDLAKTWLFNNVRDKGLFVYSFNPATGEVSSSNNALRQLMASRVLAQESAKNKDLLPLHERNLDFVFQNWYQQDTEEGYIFYDDKSKLGANAMALRTLVYSPLFEEYREQAEALAQGMLALQNTDGSFDPWYIEPDYEYDADRLLNFYSGEALLALTEYFQKTGDQELLKKILLTADFYLQEYVEQLEENYYPAYVPWHTLALNKLYQITGEKKYADAIFLMNDKLLEIQDTTDYVGRFFNPETPEYGTPHVSSDAVYTEGLAYAYEIALLAGDRERAQKYKQAIDIALLNLASLQYVGNEFPQTNPSLYRGAMRTSEENPWVRVDNAQHTVDALTKVLEVFE